MGPAYEKGQCIFEVSRKMKKRSANASTSRDVRRSSKAVIGVGVGLLIVIVLVGVGLYIAGGSLFSQVPVAPQMLVQRNRSNETPAVAHRAQTTIASQAPTTTMPWGIAIDERRGFVWVGEPGCEPLVTCHEVIAGTIGQYALADGSFIRAYGEPPGFSSPLFVALDAAGNIWFTQPNSDAIGELNPQTESWQQWAVTKGSMPYDLLIDKNGNIWFTELKAGKIGFFDPRTHKLVENPVPTPNSQPYGITMDPQGNVWFSENKAGLGQIGFFVPSLSGKATIVEHAVDTARPHMITTDSAGNVWFTGGFQGTIGEFNPTTSDSRSFFVSSNICPNPDACYNTHISGIGVDSHGNVWFDDSLSQRVGYLNPRTGQVVTKRLPNKIAHPYDGLVVQSNGTVWFTQQDILLLAMWPSGTLK
jgi:streptogramin lyase